MQRTRTSTSIHLSLRSCGLAAAAGVLFACGSDPSPGRGDSDDLGFDSPPGRAGIVSLAGRGAPNVDASGPRFDDSCASISKQAENQRRPADIIIAVDNSGSMREEIAFVRERLNAFSQQIIDSGVDVRIILISAPYGPAPVPTGDEDDDSDEGDSGDDNGICIAPPLGSGMCPLDTKAPRYFHVPREVSSNDALELFVRTFPQWQIRLRANASKTFVVVTDDDADGSAAQFQQNVAGLPGGAFSSWSFSGIYCFSRCPAAAAVGTVYDALVQATNGVRGDLCQQDFAPVFDALAKSVVANSGLDCAWDIPQPAAGQTFNREQVNVQYTLQGGRPRALSQVPTAAECGAGRAGWHYDDAANPQRILVCPATCTELKGDLTAKVEVLFGCDTVVAPQ
jgi:hypothetical protein